jgi:predicted enzyme related to lactoylglutathione lyase
MSHDHGHHTDITIHASVLPDTDQDVSLAFYRDVLGFEVRDHVACGERRWITVGPAEQPDRSIILEPPAADPGVTERQRGTILQMMANGSYARIVLATADLIGVFERLEASGADVIQEPIEQPSGVRECAFHDPACNLIRIIEPRGAMPIRQRRS